VTSDHAPSPTVATPTRRRPAPLLSAVASPTGRTVTPLAGNTRRIWWFTVAAAAAQ
jgi:hypothetical protein